MRARELIGTWLACASVALACEARREPIAIVRPGATPFRFPYVDPAVPKAPDQFGAAAGGAAGAPAIVYPLDGAMHPINIGELTFQWRRGDAGNRLFRIRLDGDGARYDFYVPCTIASCLYTLPTAGWLAISYAHADRTLQATVEGTDGQGGPVFRSRPIDVRFSPEAVIGGLYYWTATSTGGTTYRLPFGASHASPFIIPSSPTNPLPCSGCHSVSRDGTMISFVATADLGSQVAFLAAAPTNAPAAPGIVPTVTAGAPTGTAARFTALDTNGRRVLVTTFGRIQMFDTGSGQPIDIGDANGLLPPGKAVTHPEWSPDGRRVALTLYSAETPDGAGTRAISDSRPEDGEIVTLELDPATGAATRLRRLVATSAADGLAHFYPSWSPDGRWLVMAAAPRGTSAYIATTARLRLASADVDGQQCPGPTCFDLARASQGTSVSSTWPKLSPFSQASGQLLFVTFSSKIDYGLALTNTGPNGAQRAQLWMAAIDLRQAASGGDPSLPPFWLPFQDITEANHLPFWSALVACSDDGISYARCGANEVCDQGACRVVVE
jgi:Tol biopolymer transport system component